jgi:hypothetical protein
VWRAALERVSRALCQSCVTPDTGVRPSNNSYRPCAAPDALIELKVGEITGIVGAGYRLRVEDEVVSGAGAERSDLDAGALRPGGAVVILKGPLPRDYSTS